jgi:hypothetical protein
MSMLWYLSGGLYLVIWSALLIHCLLRRRFYPVFGTGWGTKVFWLLTFVFFDPLLTFLYFVFGFLLRPVKTGASNKPIDFGSVVAIIFVGFVLVCYEWPFTGYGAGPVVICSESQEPEPSPSSEAMSRASSLRFEAGTGLPAVETKGNPRLSGGGVIPAKAGMPSPRGTSFGPVKTRPGWLYHIWYRVSNFGADTCLEVAEAHNGVQTFVSVLPRSDARASVRSIMLICRNPHRLLDRLTRQLQKSLVRLPEVDKVEYYPYGTRPELGGILPDVFITVDALEFDEREFLRSRRLEAIIQWNVANTLFAGPSAAGTSYGAAVVGFNAESRLDHKSTLVGIESPRAKYKFEADGICAEMARSISKQFADLLDKYGALPKAPQMLYGTYREPPTFSFLADHAAERLISGAGLLKNNYTVWRFTEKRKTDEALAAYRDELKVSGWSLKELGKDYLLMQRQNEHIYIFQQRRHDLPNGTIEGGQPNSSPAGPSGASMVARYTSDFTDEQIRQAMDALLAGETDVNTLLAFERYFRTPEQLERLHAAIEAASTSTQSQRRTD